MPAPDAVYRSLVRLYPRDFRGRYADDLVQVFADLVRDRGARAAWTRTGLDLIVTVPRYRLEAIMTDRRTTALTIAMLALASGSVLSVLAGLPLGLVLLVPALGLAVAQRRSLALAIRTPHSSRRTRRLLIAAGLALVFLGSIASFLQAISDGAISDFSLMALNVIGVPAMIGTMTFLIVGLLTPPDNAPVTVDG